MTISVSPARLTQILALIVGALVTAGVASVVWRHLGRVAGSIAVQIEPAG